MTTAPVSVEIALATVRPETVTFRPGDVVRYDVAGSRHCREGMAIANAGGVLIDTYWSSGNDRLTPTEVATARLVFNIEEFDEIGKHHFPRFEDFAREDRAVITSQHGLRVRRFLRRGAEPSLLTKIENAEARLVEAVRERDSAQWRVEAAERDLADLTSVRDDA